MANFLEDPRLRQRWNQISHNAETVTENAAAGIWNFSHNYINPCLASIGESFESCTAVCLGDREERARRRREHERLRGRAEYSFDFYDDWYADDEGGLLGGWSNEDWDRLLAGTGASGSTASRRRDLRDGEIAEQPRRKRGMSYGTRDRARRKPGASAEQDPTIIPSTQAIGFLGRLPWKIGGTLRYKPSAADLQDHPGRHDGDDREMPDEREPLLGTDSEEDEHPLYDYSRRRPRSAMQTRKRSGTAGSGDTSDSYRSRGDLFPSDGEGDEDAVPLDDEEFTVALMDKASSAAADDRASNKTRSSKGKRVARDGREMSRTVSRTTIGSTPSRLSLRGRRSSGSIGIGSPPVVPSVPSMEDLQQQEMQIEREEDEEVARKRRAASQLAAERGLRSEEGPKELKVEAETKMEDPHEEERYVEEIPEIGRGDEEARLQVGRALGDELEAGDTIPAEESAPEGASAAEQETVPTPLARLSLANGSPEFPPTPPIDTEGAHASEPPPKGPKGEAAVHSFVPARLPHFQ